jgi:hypothetical protein
MSYRRRSRELIVAARVRDECADSSLGVACAEHHQQRVRTDHSAAGSCAMCLGTRRACQRRHTVLFHRGGVVRSDGLWRAIELRRTIECRGRHFFNTIYRRKLNADTTTMLSVSRAVD